MKTGSYESGSSRPTRDQSYRPARGGSHVVLQTAKTCAEFSRTARSNTGQAILHIDHTAGFLPCDKVAVLLKTMTRSHSQSCHRRSEARLYVQARFTVIAISQHTMFESSVTHIRSLLELLHDSINLRAEGSSIQATNTYG